MHIHLTILVLLLSSLIPFCFFTGKVSIQYSITLRTNAKYNLPFAPKGKLRMAKKGNKSLNLAPSTLDHLCKSVNFTSLAHVWHLNLLLFFSLALILLRLLCTQHLQNWYLLIFSIYLFKALRKIYTCKMKYKQHL